MTSHILFVDDERNVLQGLRRMLRSMRDQWEMAFVDSGQEALQYLADNSVDVIVSDMRMPKMDGAQLLHAVSEQYPGVVRIVLSGYAENEVVAKTVGPSHQYLAKPCDPDLLASVIKRSLSLREGLKNPTLRQFVTGLQSLPSIPDVYNAFTLEVSKPTATTASVAAIIEEDIGLAAAVLKLTNSSYFSLPANVTNVAQAVQMLGFETIRSLVALTSLFSEFRGAPRHAALIKRLSMRSASVGGLARDIARLEGLSGHEVDQACCAGMLAHVGTLILMSNLPDKFDAVGRMVDSERSGIVEIEHRQFMASHAEIGAYLLGLWGFSYPVVEAVMYHHAPGTRAGESFSPATAVHVAQALSRFFDIGKGRDLRIEDIKDCLDGVHLRHIGRNDRLSAWCQHVTSIARKGDVA